MEMDLDLHAAHFGWARRLISSLRLLLVASAMAATAARGSAGAGGWWRPAASSSSVADASPHRVRTSPLQSHRRATAVPRRRRALPRAAEARGRRRGGIPAQKRRPRG